MEWTWEAPLQQMVERKQLHNVGTSKGTRRCWHAVVAAAPETRQLLPDETVEDAESDNLETFPSAPRTGRSRERRVAGPAPARR